MSVAVRRALYGKMSGDATLTAMLGSPPSGYSKAIYYQAAPDGAEFPYIVFNKQASTPRYAIGARAYDDDVWLVKAVIRSSGPGGDSPDAADDIASRLDVLLTDGTISISARTQLYLRRVSDVDFSEVSDGTLYRHAGSNFRLIYE